MKKKKQLVTIIIPTYNEAANIRPFYQAVTKVIDKLKDINFELLFVNDGSIDGTLAAINRLKKKDKRVEVIDFVRNFGKEIATTAGLHHAKGDAAIMIDADLQHPVGLIPNLIKKWHSGAEVVTGLRVDNKGQKWFFRLRSRMFYALFNKISDTTMAQGATDYQLLDRAVIDEFNRFTEHTRVTRGLIGWLGFPTEYVEFVADKRKHGSATYGTIKLIRLAINSFISLSLFPLKIAGYLGLATAGITGPLGLYMYIDRFVFKNPFSFSFSNTTMLAILIIFLVGIILSCLGLIAMYIGNIHHDVANRPLYVMRRSRR